MDARDKYLLLFFVAILAVSSLLIVKSTYAQSTSAQIPASPEFSLAFYPKSENITHTDSFTGTKTYEIIDRSTIEVKINNQPFEENINGINYYLFYSIYVTGHFDPSNQNDWRYEYSFPENNTDIPSSQQGLRATQSEYTIVSIGGDYPSNAQIDVRVGAMLMHDGQFRVYDYIGDMKGRLVSGVVQGEISGNVQTFTIPKHLTDSDSNSATTSPTQPNPTSQITSTPESTWPSESILNDLISMPLVNFIALIAVFVLVIAVLLFLLVRKRTQ
ncbi:MAG: hypothetical protein NWE92_03090 [Candidatus Bathyarchaeota archaeon]|nr:hypothetical protein [Candidatus Bathyarchaeota archaeon]